MNEKRVLTLEQRIARHREATRNWLAGLWEEGVAPSAVAFEAMVSSYSAQVEGVAVDDLVDAYPFREWRGATVTLPLPLVEHLVIAWMRYRDADAGRTFGEVLGIEGGGQGAQPARAKIKKIGRAHRAANDATIERFAEGVSWETAVATVAEAHGVSEGTVRRASEKRRRKHEHELRRRGFPI